jgi:hypothetical protein
MAGPAVALVARSAALSPASVAHVAHALQTQVDRDFGPAWGARARVRAADAAEGVPPGAWPMYLVDSPDAGYGIHVDSGGTPFAEVGAGGGWTLAASHLLLEMIADPHGNRLMDGPGFGSRLTVRRVRYLVEVCEPCRTFHYVIDGVEVSDFVTPDYYRCDGTAVDFLRLLRAPLEVRPGCSLSWQDPDDRRWHQVRTDGELATSPDPIDPSRGPRQDLERALPENAGRHALLGTRASAGRGRRAHASPEGLGVVRRRSPGRPPHRVAADRHPPPGGRC